MPWTFAHPVAVLPLHAWAKARLSFAALLVGSISPDLGYYFACFKLATLAHSPLGLVLVDLPAGIAVLCLLRVLRGPVCQLLPQPHRYALSTLPPLPRFSGQVALSILLGATTHVVWDSFTHASGYAVAQLAFLQKPIALGSGSSVLPFHLLQHVSTLFGIGLLMLAYRAWLRRVAPAPRNASKPEHWRLILLVGLALLSLLVAAPFAYSASVNGGGTLRQEAFVFRLALASTSLFSLLLCVVALARAWHMRRSKP